jgi:hypothetical protein
MVRSPCPPTSRAADKQQRREEAVPIRLEVLSCRMLPLVASETGKYTAESRLCRGSVALLVGGGQGPPTSEWKDNLAPKKRITHCRFAVVDEASRFSRSQ